MKVSQLPFIDDVHSPHSLPHLSVQVITFLTHDDGNKIFSQLGTIENNSGVPRHEHRASPSLKCLPNDEMCLF